MNRRVPASLHCLGYVQEPRTPSIDCSNRLLGTQHDHLPMCGQICQGVRKGSKVGGAGAQNISARPCPLVLAGRAAFTAESSVPTPIPSPSAASTRSRLMATNQVVKTSSGLTVKGGQALAADMPLPPPAMVAAPVGKGKAPIGKGKGPRGRA